MNTAAQTQQSHSVSRLNNAQLVKVAADIQKVDADRDNVVVNTALQQSKIPAATHRKNLDASKGGKILNIIERFVPFTKGRTN